MDITTFCLGGYERPPNLKDNLPPSLPSSLPLLIAGLPAVGRRGMLFTEYSLPASWL